MPNDTTLTTASGTWIAGQDVVRAAISAPVLVELGGLGIIAAQGADAVAFLQTQLTNDLQHLAVGHLQTNGYCTPKGRLLAVFDCWRSADTVFLQLPREILPAVLRRLSMYVLRARVRLGDASSDWTCGAVLGPGAANALARAGLSPPEVGQTHLTGTTLVARLRDSPRVPERFLVLAPHAGTETLKERLHAVRGVDAAAWWWSQIDAGIATVFAATQEKFVPQMINLEVLGGVSFKKGCYPGQEVVARSQYLGKLRRRMSIAHVHGETRAGADIYALGDTQPVGTVVMAASSPDSGMDALFEAPIDRTRNGELLANACDGPRLDVRELPYALFDPTA
ncbi:MAG TPA: folate-binding protein [Burkholderiaceae bacterium]|nr:folate-binding protein [Burkholderiaceae bacterium]